MQLLPTEPAILPAALAATPPTDIDRLLRAERRGLKLAILCRTVAILIGAAYWIGAITSSGNTPTVISVLLLIAFAGIGIVNYVLIGTRYDRWWLKYIMYTADILGVCALFAFLPVHRSGEVPQILSFRAFGIYYMFPVIAMACLSLSWRLVAWSGFVGLVGWWAAFAYVIDGMDQRVSWRDLPANATAQQFMDLLLSPNFIGVGGRVQESGFMFAAAMILALAVNRARRVFFAQLRAEEERESARADRERVARRLGRYVPEAIARRLMQDEAALAPQVRHGAVLILDIRSFTSFAASRPPTEVIGSLNTFLARCADCVSQADGVVISYTGDGLLATFNTPLEVDQPEEAALGAASALAAYAAQTDFDIRVGIAAGPVAAGSVGSAERQAFTVYGDTVNRAARLEALAKDLGRTVLVDDTVAAACNGRAKTALDAAGTHDLRGLASPVVVWALSQPHQSGAG